MDSGEMTDKQVPVPQGVTYQRYTYDGQATINLMFNVDWEATDTYEMVLSKAAFVRTLTQIESVKKVVYDTLTLQMRTVSCVRSSQMIHFQIWTTS